MSNDDVDVRWPTDPDDPGLRQAEDAFRAAFDAHADDVTLSALDPDTLRLMAGARQASEHAPAGAGATPPPRKRGGGRYALAALVVMVLAVPLVAMFVQLRGTTSSPSAVQAPAATMASGQAPEVDQSDSEGESRSGSVAAESLPEPSPGRRWVELGGVVVQVPASWAGGVAPGPDWCSAAAFVSPREPYVAFDPVEDTGDCGDLPADLQVEHLQWRPASDGELAGERTAKGWTYSTVIISGTRLTYVHKPGKDRGILQTARTAP